MEIETTDDREFEEIVEKYEEEILMQEVKRPDFREGKSTESKCIMTDVDHITQIPVEYHIHTMIISEYK